MKWISIYDRLPKMRQDEEWENCSEVVLILRRYPELGYQEPVKGFYIREDDYQEWSDENGFTLNYVTHWMQLPEPPL